MKRISLTLAAVSFIAALCAAQQFPPADLSGFRQEGIASWYGGEFNGRPTASGEIFNSSLYTAAHPTLPFGTMLTVTNLNNGRKVTVKVNDRGPFVSSRIIDLSQAAAQMLDMLKEGTAPVLVEAAGSQASDSAYWTETNSYAYSGGGTSSANSQITAPPYPVYQTPSQDPVVIQVQPQNPPPVQAPPQQQITQYFQQPVQSAQPAQPAQPVQPPARQPVQQPPMQQIQPVQQVLPVQQVQPVIQPMRLLVQPVVVPPQQAAPQGQSLPQGQQTQPAQSQITQPLQIQIPIEVKPIVSAEPVAPVTVKIPVSPPAAAAETPAVISPAAPPASQSALPAPVTVILTPENPAPAVPPIQVTVKPHTNYRVQIGSFKEARNALAVFERLKEAGLNPVYERHDEFFRVVLSGIPSENMAEILRKLQLAGFNEPLLREER
ncbi:MAG: septal ring lytic transglycosylase RlpA family protein [Treponema sp.]|jgi:rare lipoprotein A|nr:septal ring lytic transglycosylase RlpA family protein [Treponema sp.]